MSNKTTITEGTATTKTDSFEAYPTGYDHVSDITKPLNELARHYSKSRLFDDWLTLMLTSLAGDDDAYMRVADTYDQEELDAFVTAFAELMAVTEQYQVDVLGDAYEAFGMQAENFGQHFTPHATSEAMAEMQMTVQERETDDEPLRIADPTCGSGRLLIAAARRAPDGDFHGVDKDPMCAKMAAINLTLFGLSGVIVHGDSLSLDCYRVWDVRDGRVAELDLTDDEKDEWLAQYYADD